MSKVQGFCHFGSILCQLQFRHFAAYFRRDYALEDHVQDKTESKSALDVREVKPFNVKIFPCQKKNKEKGERDFSINVKKFPARTKCRKQLNNCDSEKAGIM